MHISRVLSEVLIVSVKRDRHFVTQLVGKTSSSLGASSLKNLSAVSRSHSLSEAVNLFSLSFLRLIRSLH